MTTNEGFVTERLVKAREYALEHQDELLAQRELALADGDIDYALFVHNLVRGLTGIEQPPLELATASLIDLLECASRQQ